PKSIECQHTVFEGVRAAFREIDRAESTRARCGAAPHYCALLPDVWHGSGVAAPRSGREVPVGRANEATKIERDVHDVLWPVHAFRVTIASPSETERNHERTFRHPGPGRRLRQPAQLRPSSHGRPNPRSPVIHYRR